MAVSHLPRIGTGQLTSNGYHDEENLQENRRRNLKNNYRTSSPETDSRDIYRKWTGAKSRELAKVADDNYGHHLSRREIFEQTRKRGESLERRKVEKGKHKNSISVENGKHDSKRRPDSNNNSISAGEYFDDHVQKVKQKFWTGQTNRDRISPKVSSDANSCDTTLKGRRKSIYQNNNQEFKQKNTAGLHNSLERHKHGFERNKRARLPNVNGHKRHSVSEAESVSSNATVRNSSFPSQQGSSSSDKIFPWKRKLVLKDEQSDWVTKSVTLKDCGHDSSDSEEDVYHFHAKNKKSGTNEDVIIKTLQPQSRSRTFSKLSSRDLKLKRQRSKLQHGKSFILKKENSNAHRHQSLPPRKENHVLDSQPRNATSAPTRDQEEPDNPVPKMNSLVKDDMEETAPSTGAAKRAETERQRDKKQSKPSSFKERKEEPASQGRVSALTADILDQQENGDQNFFPDKKSSDADQFQYYASVKNKSKPAKPALDTSAESKTALEKKSVKQILDDSGDLDSKRREVTIVDPRDLRKSETEFFPEEYQYHHTEPESEEEKPKTIAEMDDDERFEYFRTHTKLPPEQIRELTFHPKVNEPQAIHKAYTGIDTLNREAAYSGLSPREASAKRPKSRKKSVYKKVKPVLPYQRESFMFNTLQTKVYRQINTVYGNSPRRQREKQFYERLAQVQLNEYRQRYEMLEEKERKRLESKFRQREQLRRLRKRFEKDAWKRFMTQYVTSRVLEAEQKDRSNYGLPNSLDDDLVHDYRMRRRQLIKKFQDINPENTLNKKKKTFNNMFHFKVGPVWNSNAPPPKMEGIDTVMLESEDEYGNKVQRRQNVQALMKEAIDLLDQTDFDDTDIEDVQVDLQRQIQRRRRRARDTRQNRPTHGRSRSRSRSHKRGDEEKKGSPERREKGNVTLPQVDKRYRRSEFMVNQDILQHSSRFQDKDSSMNTTLNSKSSKTKSTDVGVSDTSGSPFNVSLSTDKDKPQGNDVPKTKDKVDEQKSANPDQKRKEVTHTTFEEVVTQMGTVTDKPTPVPSPDRISPDKRQASKAGSKVNSPQGSALNVNPSPTRTTTTTTTVVTTTTTVIKTKPQSPERTGKTTTPSITDVTEKHDNKAQTGSVPQSRRGSVVSVRETVKGKLVNGNKQESATKQPPQTQFSRRNSRHSVMSQSQPSNEPGTGSPFRNDRKVNGAVKSEATVTETTTTKTTTTPESPQQSRRQSSDEGRKKNGSPYASTNGKVVQNSQAGRRQSIDSNMSKANNSYSTQKSVITEQQNAQPKISQHKTVHYSEVETVKVMTPQEIPGYRSKARDGYSRREASLERQALTVPKPVQYEQRRKSVTTTGQDSRRNSHRSDSESRSRSKDSRPRRDADHPRGRQGMTNGYRDHETRDRNRENVGDSNRGQQTIRKEDTSLPSIANKESRHKPKHKEQHSKSKKSVHKSVSERTVVIQNGYGDSPDHSDYRRTTTPADDEAKQGSKWKDLVQKYLHQPAVVTGKTEDRSVLEAVTTDEDDDETSDIFERARRRYRLDVDDDDDDDD